MEVGIKRKRGRPRKSESSSSIIISSSSSGRDEMVGQVIRGVVEASFEAGYLVNVQLTSIGIGIGIGEEDEDNLRGVVFRGDKVCPITITNDVAPHAKMYLRKHHTTPSTSIHHPQQANININSTTPSIAPDLNNNYLSSSPINTHTTTNKPSPTTPFLVPVLFTNTHHQKPNPPNYDDDDFNPPKNTCTTSFEEEEEDKLFLTRQLLNPTNTTTHHQLFINSTTNYNTNNLNLELNQPPTTFLESQPPIRKLMDMFPTTFNTHAASTTDQYHSTSSSSSSSAIKSTPQLLHEDQPPKLWDNPVSMALAGPPITTTQATIIVEHPTTTHSAGSAPPSTNTCN